MHKNIYVRALAMGLCLVGALPVTQAAEPTGSSTSSASKPASSLLDLADGRSGRGNLIATTGVRGFSKPPTATAHALIMTIGDYQSGVPKLTGVPYDAATATEIATRMGVPPDNIVRMKDRELTLAGMRKAFDDLEARLGGNDQVFIYYSGHGGRQLVKEDAGERCAESLITVDGQAFLDTEMEARLKQLSGKVQKAIVFLDACHSGGVTTRSVNMAEPLYNAKAYSPPGQSCIKPSNVLTRSVILSKVPGSGGGNFTYIAAARDSEVSLDQPGRGGVASQAWLACLSGAAIDTDGSGGLSADEVQACAQIRINKQLQGAQGFLPHHITITGNSSMVLSYAQREATPILAAAAATGGAAATAGAAATTGAATTAAVATGAATGAAAAGTLATAAAGTAAAAAAIRPGTGTAVPAAPAAAAAAAAPASPSAIAALMDIYNNRDDRKLVSLRAAKPVLKIGKDSVDFTVTSRESGYLYLLMAGSDGKTFDLLFPNQLDQNNQVQAGASIRLPRPAWALNSEGPPGKNTLLAMVTETPRDFASAGLTASGPFSSAHAMAGKDIQLVSANAVPPAQGECANPTLVRNLAVQRRCSAGYAAALLTIEEVR